MGLDKKAQAYRLGMVRRLDKWAGVPLYVQLARAVRAQVEAGELRPGDVLPGEKDMAAEWGVSRGTVRRALEILRDSGHVQTAATIGTRVRQREDWADDGQ
jgi:DNA-binding GntR family transcriptional regulator